NGVGLFFLRKLDGGCHDYVTRVLLREKMDVKTSGRCIAAANEPASNRPTAGGTGSNRRNPPAGIAYFPERGWLKGVAGTVSRRPYHRTRIAADMKANRRESGSPLCIFSAA